MTLMKRNICLVAMMMMMTCAQDGEIQEICNMETFEGKCSADDIIVMTSAWYGRMKAGKCADPAYGFVGCKVDVISVADDKCSGRKSCRVKLPDDDMYVMSKCPKEVTSYLQVSYKCLEVEASMSAKCSSGTPIIMTSQQGSIVGPPPLSGQQRSCMWHVDVGRGRKINFTLIDFNAGRASHHHHQQQQQTAVSNQHHHHHHQPNSPCLKYATIREQTFPIPHTPSTTSPMATRDATEFVVCGGEGTRERPLYVSRGSHVTVQTVYVTSGRGQSQDDVILFVLSYEAIGCPDLHVASHVMTRRDGDRVSVACDNTTTKHYLSCIDGKWVGTIPECHLHNKHDDFHSESIWGNVGFFSDSSLAILLTVGVGMALGVVIGSVLLLLLLAYCKSREGPQNAITRHPPESIYGDPSKHYSRSLLGVNSECRQLALTPYCPHSDLPLNKTLPGSTAIQPQQTTWVQDNPTPPHNPLGIVPPPLIDPKKYLTPDHFYEPTG